MSTGIEPVVSQALQRAAQHVAKRLYRAYTRSRIENEARTLVPETVGLRLVEGLAPSQIDALHRYISSADFELVAYQVIMGRTLIALDADQEEVLTSTREALRQGLRHFVVLSPAELMTTTDTLLDLLRTAAITVAADFDVNDLGTRDLAPLAQLLTAAARNSSLLTRVEGVFNFHRFADDLRRQIEQMHNVLRLPHTGLNRAVPYAQLYIEARLRDMPEQANVEGLLGQDQRTVVLGGPGAGKSTLMAKLAYDVAATSERAPFFVPLRDFTEAFEHSTPTLLDLFCARSRAPYNLDPSTDAVEYLLLNGRAVAILDGLDEIIDVALRRRVADSIEAFAARYPSVPIVVTARLVGYAEAPLNPRVFRIATIDDFDEEQVARYADQWFSLDETLLQAERRARCEAFLRDSQTVPDLRRVPLMLSLLCALYSMEGHDFPRDRPQVYESCALMLFQKWDAMRGVRGAPRFTTQFRGALQTLAWRMYRARDESPYLARPKILAEITEYLRARRFDSTDEAREVAEQFLKFCTERAWVLMQTGVSRGEPLYGFAHPTFLEYFAAEHIVRTSQGAREVFEKIWQYFTNVDADELCELTVLMLDRKNADGGDEILELALDDAAHRLPYRKAAIRSFAARTLSYAAPSPTIVRRTVDHAVDSASSIAPADRLATVASQAAREQIATVDRPLQDLLHRCSIDNEPLVMKYLIQRLEAALEAADEASAFILLNVEQFASAGDGPDQPARIDVLRQLRSKVGAQLDAVARADLSCAISRSRQDPLWLQRIVDTFGPAGLYLRTAIGRALLPAPAEVLLRGLAALSPDEAADPGQRNTDPYFAPDPSRTVVEALTGVRRDQLSPARLVQSLLAAQRPWLPVTRHLSLPFGDDPGAAATLLPEPGPTVLLPNPGAYGRAAVMVWFLVALPYLEHLADPQQEIFDDVAGLAAQVDRRVSTVRARHGYHPVDHPANRLVQARQQGGVDGRQLDDDLLKSVPDKRVTELVHQWLAGQASVLSTVRDA